MYKKYGIKVLYIFKLELAFKLYFKHILNFLIYKKTHLIIYDIFFNLWDYLTLIMKNDNLILQLISLSCKKNNKLIFIKNDFLFNFRLYAT